MKDGVFRGIICCLLVIAIALLGRTLYKIQAIENKQDIVIGEKKVQQVSEGWTEVMSRAININNKDIAECAECGCLIYKNKAVVEKEIISIEWHEHPWVINKPEIEDYIEYTYYCKKCAGNRGIQ